MQYYTAVVKIEHMITGMNLKIIMWSERSQRAPPPQNSIYYMIELENSKLIYSDRKGFPGSLG